MKILILTQWYPPEPQDFLAEMAQSLQALGHRVTVLTGFPNWPTGKIYQGYRLRLWQRETLEGIQVVRVPLYPDHSRSGLRRFLNYISFALSASVLGPFLIKRTDAIHVIPPITAALPAWILSRLWHVPFTHEIQDLWPETLEATGMVKNGRALAAVGVFAKWVYRASAAIRVISPGFKSNLLEKGVPAEKTHIISNWVDTAFYRPVAPDLKLSEALGLSGRFNILYAGAMGPAQALESVLNAAKLLVDLPEVQIVFIGDGVDRLPLQEAAQAQELPNVIFLGRYPSESMPAMYSLADALLVNLRPDPLFRITIPHKIFTYLASGKPVVGAVEGDAAAVIESSRSGLTCAAGDSMALAGAIRRLYRMPPTERSAFGSNGRRTACEEYGREKLVMDLAAMLVTASRVHNSRNRAELQKD